MPRSPLPLRAFAVVVAAALAGCAAALAHLDPSPDESWMVLVANRLAHGERLYQDVFCGVTPLALQLQVAFQAVFGPSIAVLRGLSYLVYALSALVVLSTGITLRLSRSQLAFLLVSTLVWTVPDGTAIYSYWAVLFALSAQYCALRSVRSLNPARWIAAAGVGAGLAFAAKQNVGLLCLAALLAALAFSRTRRLLPLAAGAFAFAAAVPLVPIALTGGLPALFHFGFLNKTVYARAAALPYWNYVHLTPLALWQNSGLRSGTLLWGQSLLYLAPLLLLAIPLQARKRHATLWMQLAFTIAAFGFVYPRPDRVHMILCAPFVALSLARLLPRSGVVRWAAWGFGALLLLQFAFWGRMLSKPFPATLPGRDAFHSLRLTRDFATFAEAAATQLPPRQPDARGIFLLHPLASTLYLAAGVPNPTPYDFPLNSAFGPHGQSQLIQQLRDGKIPAVCLPDEIWTTDPQWRGFAPDQLINYVRTEMTPGPALSICRLYLPR